MQAGENDGSTRRHPRTYLGICDERKHANVEGFKKRRGNDKPGVGAIQDCYTIINLTDAVIDKSRCTIALGQYPHVSRQGPADTQRLKAHATLGACTKAHMAQVH